MISIVTDSSSYFRKADALEMGIRIVSNNYIVNGQSYSESFSDDNGELETLLSGNARIWVDFISYQTALKNRHKLPWRFFSL